MVIYLFFAFGVTLNGVIFMILKDWQVILLVYQILPFLVMLVGIVYFIEETPFDSIVHCEPQETLRAFERIARINGRE
jgi:hypothetical protein